MNGKSRRRSTDPVSHRGFLNRVVAGGIGGIVAEQVEIARAAHVAGTEAIKVALIGCGSRGAGAASQILKTEGPVKLWAMADLFEDRLDSSLTNLLKGQEADYDREAHAGFAARIDVPRERRFVGFDAYRSAIDSGVDLVILATHAHFRPMQFAYAVEQGKHIFTEKPLAIDASGVRRVLAANRQAQQKNLKVAVGLQMRHHVKYQETVQRLRDGAIGPIDLMRCFWNTSLLRDTPPRPPEMTEMMYQLRNPYHFVWLNGDYIVDALIHYLDMCNWLQGSHPIEAQGQGGRTFRLPNQSGDTFDHHAVEFTYANGSKMFAQTRQMSGCWNSSSVHVHGPKGSADVGAGRIEGETPWRFRGRTVANPYQAEQDALIDAICNDKPYNEVEYAATTTMTGILGRMASYSGQMMRWDEAMDSTVSLAPSAYAFDATPPVVADTGGHYPVATPGATKVL